MRVTKGARDRVRDICASLGTLDVTKPSNFDTELGAIRELTDFEAIALYSLSHRDGRWEVSRFAAVGTASDMGPLLRRVFRRTDAFPLYFEPQSPPRDQRNRVVDSLEWIERTKPGSWDQNLMCQAVLRPFQLHRHHQPRALLYDGNTQLAWFGALHPTCASRYQLEILRAMIEPMRRRLAIEHRLFGAPYVMAALATTLERLDAPAFIINARGTVFEANHAGRALLEMSGRAALVQLRHAASGARSGSIDLVPISDAFFLAIVRHVSSPARTQVCLQSCTARWKLTRRQREVLALVVEGLSNAAIAERLKRVERTVEMHMTALFDRVGVDNRSALVAKVLTS